MRKTLCGFMVMAFMLLIVVASMATFVGCAKTFIGKAQQSHDVLRDICDTWFTFEKANRDFCERVMPGSHAKTEEMRRVVPRILTDLETAIDEYRALQKGGASAATLDMTAAKVTAKLSDLTVQAGACQSFIDSTASAPK